MTSHPAFATCAVAESVDLISADILLNGGIGNSVSIQQETGDGGMNQLFQLIDL